MDKLRQKVPFLTPLSLITFLFLLGFYFFLYKLFIPRVNAFGCFDDCFNFMGGYFILKGKTLYSEVFFNHQMLMAYISYLIQLVQTPTNLYELILVHRKFLLLFSFALNVLIIFRFRLVGVSFALLYEFTKFYLFGDRFLAEGFIVYPIVYMGGLVWYRLQQQTIKIYDYILCAIFTWFIIFMREPYIPLAFLLYGIILFGKPLTVSKKVSVVLFIVLTGIVLSITPMQDYYFNLITINQQTVLAYETSKGNFGVFGLAKIFFYPSFLFFGGEWNIFRHVIIGINSIFLSLTFYLSFFKKKRKLILLLLLILGLANVRPVNPGHVFYDAFHMLPWYGLFLFFTFLLLHDYYLKKRKYAYILIGIVISLLSYVLLSPRSYIHEKQYPHETFITNYGKELQAGEGIRKLSQPPDTVFLDGSDDLIYWQADKLSPYRYSWYTSVMPHIPRYSLERLRMFKENPPDFYYGSCPRETDPTRTLPNASKNHYVRLLQHGKPSCLFVKKEKLKEITADQWKQASEFGYTR